MTRGMVFYTLLCVPLFILTILPTDVDCQNPSEEISGNTITGVFPSVRTSSDIMFEESQASTARSPQSTRKSIEFEVERRDLPQNPASPLESSWPPQSNPIKSQRELIPMSPQVPSTSFTGATLAETGAFPPDAMGTIGPSQFMVVVNGRIKTFDKTNGLSDGVLNTGTDIFFSPVMTPSVNNFTSDPRVRYDRYSRRWFAIMIDVPGGRGAQPNRVLLAVSDSGIIRPSTVWSFYYFLADSTLFSDYPTLGLDKNALYIGCNQFTSGGSFSGTSAYVIRKSSILNGGPIVVTAFRNLTGSPNGSGPYTPQGVDIFDTLSSNGYFIGVDNRSFGTLMLRRVANPGIIPTISPNISITVPTTDYPMQVPHLGNTNLNGSNGYLDAIDDRLYMALIRDGFLWTVHNIAVTNTGVASGSTTRDGSRWYEIQNITGNSPSLVQSGTVYDPASPNDLTKRNYWMPSIMVSGQGHAAMAFTTAGMNEFANAGTVGRLAGDSPGTMQSPVLYTESSTAYNPPGDTGGPQGRRWGDYSYSSLDPNDDMTIWSIVEFCDATNSYGVRVAKLLAPAPATPDSLLPATISAGSIDTVTLHGISISGSGFYDPGLTFPNHISVTVHGGGITVNSVTYVSPTSLTLNLTVAGNALSGGRTITVSNPDDQSVTSSTGILTVSGISCSPILLSPAVLPSATVGTFYTQTVTASGGISPYSYSVTSGVLPNGLTLSPAGNLSGIPSTKITSHFTITAIDSNGCPGSRAETLDVQCPAMTLSPQTIPDGTIGFSYSRSFLASGGKSPYDYSVASGSLPPGLILSIDGTLSGTPSASGIYHFQIMVTDSFGCNANFSDSLRIVCPLLSVFPQVLPHGNRNITFAETLFATGGKTPYTFQLISGGLPNGVSLSSNGILNGSPSHWDSVEFTISVIDSNGCSGQRTYTVIIDTLPLIEVDLSVASDWNIISNPVVGSSDSVQILYPSASSPAFGYTVATGYQTSSLLVPLKGYWLRFGAAQLIRLIGRNQVIDSVGVSDGWNLIGTRSAAVNISQITASGASVSSSFFGYLNGYTNVDTLYPGKGYWVKCSGQGTLLFQPFSSLAPGKDKNPARWNSTAWNRIDFTDGNGYRQSLYFTRDTIQRTDTDQFELPPVPPDGAFDARFSTGKYLEFYHDDQVVSTLRIRLQSNAYPVIGRWYRGAGSDNMYIQTSPTKLISLAAPTGTFRIEDGNVKSVILSIDHTASVPSSYRLFDNYPNPFNPVTSIVYELPVVSRLRITVMNILGEEIKVLESGLKGAGRYRVEWDGKNSYDEMVSSGMYLLRMDATPVDARGNSYSRIHKIILMK